MSNTPVSDILSAYSESNSPAAWAHFLDAFRRSSVGVVVEGLPPGEAGTHTTTAAQPVWLGETLHAGRPMILAFADPAAFAERFGRPFQASMAGEAVLSTARKNPDCAGVLVNSALARVSVVIDRATIEALAGRPAPKPWWRFW